MDELAHKLNIYNGSDPYIYTSFHSDDREKIIHILEKLDSRGFRFWSNDGIAPGMESDEIIAEHIENCDFFIAFLSDHYLNCLDTVDELNYSRDTNKPYLLIFLDDVSLPAGLDMRFMRAQSIKAYLLNDEEVFTQITAIDAVDNFYGITDPKYRKSAENLFSQLHDIYPEHKVFALDAISGNLSSRISELYVKTGYSSINSLLKDYGFEQISMEQARSLRSSVLYQPGFEPDSIKTRINYIVETLRRDYPDGTISDTLFKSHKSISKSLQGLSVWLGYENMADMLEAYGFTGITSKSGRIAVDSKAVLEQLEKRYEGKRRPTGYSQILAENPDLAGNLKTLSNRSNELFGMTFVKYLKSNGFIEEKTSQTAIEEKTSQTAIRRTQIIEEIRKAYDSGVPGGDSFADIESTLNQLILKKNSQGEVYITDCSSCSEIMRIPYGVNFIHKEAFSGQEDLVTLILPPTLKSIRDGAFIDCNSLQNVIFSEGLENIGNEAFFGCLSLNQLTFPKTLKAIGNKAFSDCEVLSDVEFKNLRVNVQEDAFDGCIFKLENLQDTDASPAEYFELKVDKKNNAQITKYIGKEEIVVIPSMISGHPITSIEKGSFKGNEIVKEVYMSDQIKGVNGDVFKQCRNLTKIHISNAVTKLTGTIFDGCESLIEVNIPDNMEEVQRGLFKDSPLTTLYIGERVSKISADAFYKGTVDFATGIYHKKKVLTNLIIGIKNTFFKANGTMLLSADGKILITELGDPQKAVIPEGIEEIAPKAYENLSTLTEVVLPSTLKKIGEKAFAGTNIKSLNCPKELKTIDPQAFSYCRMLRKLDLNEKLKIIGAQAFEGCPINDVYIPASVEFIGNASFLCISTYQGDGKQTFKVDTANTHIVADGIALYVKINEEQVLVKAYNPILRISPNAEDVETVRYEIKEGTAVIGEQAFARCNNLEEIIIPDGVKSIKDMAFWDCSRLTQIHIPESCENISGKAFFGCTIDFI